MKSLNILQISTTDIGGGAEKVAWNLFQEYRHYGHHSWLAVGTKKSSDPDVINIPNDAYRNYWARFWRKTASRIKDLDGKVRGAWRIHEFLNCLAEPKREFNRFLGREDFDFPGSNYLLDLLPEKPDIVHCHNLHGNYFDLNTLHQLTHQVPVVLTLHDAWLLSGHCAHSFDCERWKIGCGHCPDLTIYPSMRRDSTVYNWRRKQKIYARSKLYVTTPSRWLMQKIKQSILATAVMETRVISNGVDLSIFHPADKKLVRSTLSIPQDTKVVIFTANGIRKNIWKDYQTMRASIALVARRLIKEKLLFIALGEDMPEERIDHCEVRFVSYQKDADVVARYYQAADVYIHAAKTDTFPNTVLEALACGTPVVATAVGGIPEQVQDGATGFLVPYRDVATMSTRINQLLNDVLLRKKISMKAAEIARQRFDLKQQVNNYLTWYSEILERWHKPTEHTRKIYGQ